MMLRFLGLICLAGLMPCYAEVSLSQDPEAGSLYTGDLLTLRCLATDVVYGDTITWHYLRSGGTEEYIGSHFRLSGRFLTDMHYALNLPGSVELNDRYWPIFRLFITNVSTSDQGTYTCRNPRLGEASNLLIQIQSGERPSGESIDVSTIYSLENIEFGRDMDYINSYEFEFWEAWPRHEWDYYMYQYYDSSSSDETSHDVKKREVGEELSEDSFSTCLRNIINTEPTNEIHSGRNFLKFLRTLGIRGKKILEICCNKTEAGRSTQIVQCFENEVRQEITKTSNEDGQDQDVSTSLTCCEKGRKYAKKLRQEGAVPCQKGGSEVSQGMDFVTQSMCNWTFTQCCLSQASLSDDLEKGKGK